MVDEFDLLRTSGLETTNVDERVQSRSEKPELTPEAKAKRDIFEKEAVESSQSSLENALGALSTDYIVTSRRESEAAAKDALARDIASVLENNPVANRQLGEILRDTDSSLKDNINYQLNRAGVTGFNLEDYTPAETS